MNKNQIKRIITSSSQANNKKYPTVQGNYLGKTKDFRVFIPYGLISSAPSGSEGITMQILCQEDDSIVILSDVEGRKKDIKDGETGLENTVTGVNIILNDSGDVVINNANNVQINSNTEINGDLTLNGNLTMTGNANITGNLTVTGSVTAATGAFTTGASIAGKDFITHVHSGVSSGPSNTGGVV